MFRKSMTSTKTRSMAARRVGSMWAAAGLALTMLAHAQPSSMRNGTLDLDACTPLPSWRTLALTAGQALSESYGVANSSGKVDIDVLTDGASCMKTGNSLNCAALNLAVQGPVPPSDIPGSTTVLVTSAAIGGALGTEVKWATQASNHNGDPKTCKQSYRARVTADGGGWGDPHLTTVDGVQYDFQSAGEFTALRQKGLEIQTRQTPVPTATVPITNSYTGITHCVAIYTAVAAKLGSSRITLQPGLASGEASPNGMQLRVNGTLTEITDKGVVLRSGGGGSDAAAPAGTFDGVIKKAATGAFEITDASGTQLVVTPAYWDAQHLWYLNVNVYQTSATLGTMGKIAEGSWLPALPDGTSLGPKPESEDQRYQDLYKKFADGWRVTGDTSLFDYAKDQGQNTATFTLDEWPRNHPTSCAIKDQVSVQGTTPEAAAQACSAVTDAARKANCEFDVASTGHVGFGKSYEAMQAYQPAGTGWANVDPGGNVGPGPTTPWWKKWWWLILLVLLLIIVLLLRRKK